MDEPPGTMPPQAPHPRRPPAHNSVSLRHSPPAARPLPQASFYQPYEKASQSSNNGPASDRANAPSSASPAPRITNKPSSGESSDAGKWFDNTNNAASQGNASYFDNEPPFFLRNSSSSETPPEDKPAGTTHLNVPAQPKMMPYRPGLPHFGTEGSGTEDFRSVIDDLTVANKRLKQKLRKYERLYDAHLQNDKLFEVRFHGLPDHKKKELEESLRKFAAELDSSPSTGNSQGSYAPALDHKPASSHTSRFAESGYASMSASGLNLSSGHFGQDDDRRKSAKSVLHRQQQNVQAYLSDIPAGLMPRYSAPMSDKSKKKLVVRRLEQIFAGKRSVPGNHPMPMQQEEVAQSAALADRQAKASSGQNFKREGHREARIMAASGADEEIAQRQPQDPLLKFRPSLGVLEQDLSGSGSPDQRPTRPLDLDPSRAQVPEDNMEYIRHLGFTPPDMVSGAPPEDDHGWIYLNLLTNMAQLHTINVTPDYVKEAVKEYSHKFELSHDGRKIRWKGGHELTRNSDSSSEQLNGSSPQHNVGVANSTSPPKLSNRGSSGSTNEGHRRAKRMARAAREKEQGKFAYTPLFFHKDDSEDDDDSYDLDLRSSEVSPFRSHARGDSSGFASTAMRSNSSRKWRDDGPIIFYNKAKFCTDLSGDRRGCSVATPGSYKSLTTQPIGATPLPSVQGQASERRSSMEASPMHSLDAKGMTSSEDDISFSPEALRSDVDYQHPDAMEFEASGVGGVQPDDHFAIKVRRSHVRSKCLGPASNRNNAPRHNLYPRKILEALREQSSSEDDKDSRQSIIKEEIISAARRDLPNSTLPPASFLPFDSTSSGDADSDLDSDVSSGPSSSSSEDDEPPRHTLDEILVNISPTYPGAQFPAEDSRESEEMDEEDDDSEDDESGSVDLLATARALDPTTIIASEREYDAALADRLAEEIPAG
ncbi:frequency clock protein, partial [Clohesyomyces aquaticus]